VWLRTGTVGAAWSALKSEPISPVAEISLCDHLGKIPPGVRPTVEAAVRAVKDVAPKANEITYRRHLPRSGRAMWKIVRYAVGGANVVGIGTFPRHANPFFYRGRELDDGSGQLQGGGKDLRFITLRAPADAERPVVKRFVRKAFKLGGSATSGIKS
jgi:hypothetical protein